MKKKKENKEQEYLELLQRLQAEFENYRKRTEREKEEWISKAAEGITASFLPVLDSFELALKHNKDEGIKMIYSQLYSILEKEGLSKINAEGEFNPELHEALMQEEGNEDNKIIEELQRGYMLNGKVIRPSKVKISKIKEGKNE